MSDWAELVELANSTDSRELRSIVEQTRSGKTPLFSLPTKLIEARKEHRCTWCGKQIAKGVAHHYWRSVGDSFVVNRMHPECLGAAVGAAQFEYKPFKGKRPKVSKDGA